eukprot:TRINITY_DN15212_c0_g2_i1.p1 TRINITY_DN15212_c0_g2~~TRINITY_DN15212_c0_g2_i1.p1  ORF type:complete len:1213 (-),score=242.25 TRINITY_DN15212_c0_g2_i1:277-3915(-)
MSRMSAASLGLGSARRSGSDVSRASSTGGAARFTTMLRLFSLGQIDDEGVMEKIWLPTRKQKLYTSLLKELITQQVSIATANGWPAEAKDVATAVKLLAQELRGTSGREAVPSLVICLMSERIDSGEVLDALCEQFPKTRNFHCSTSCRGVLDGTGFKAVDGKDGAGPMALGLWAIFDPLGSYCTVALSPAPSKDMLTQRKSIRTSRSSRRVSKIGSMPAVEQLDSMFGLNQRPSISNLPIMLGRESFMDQRSQFSTELLDSDSFFTRLDAAYIELRKQAQTVLRNPGTEDNEIGPEPLSEHLMLWMNALPGMEEGALEALYHWGQSRFNRSIPVVGGSSADSTIGGKWFCFCQEHGGSRFRFDAGNEGMVVTLVAASVKTHTLFMHPFTPVSEFTAKVVTCGTTGEERGEAQGRVIHRVRDTEGVEHFAGNLYHKWCEEQIQENLMPPPEPASETGFSAAVLKASTLCPIGIPVAREGDDAFDYRMLHPSGIYFFEDGEDKAAGSAYLKAFAAVEAQQSELVLMKARRGDLLGRLAKMKEQLILQLDRSVSAGGDQATVGGSPDALRARVAGALQVYCAGCMMGLNSGADGLEQMRRLSVALSGVYGGRPFMAIHPFGEQGFYPSKQRSMQANLMWSSMVFTLDPCFELDESQDFQATILDLLQNVSGTANGRHGSRVDAMLRQLLFHGHNVNWKDLGVLVDSNQISLRLLQDMAVCVSQPVLFALNAAKLFFRLAQQRPLKASMYNNASEWYKQFSAELVEVAPMRQISTGQLLDDETVKLAVQLASQIDAKSLVASQFFQDIIQEVWVTGGSSDSAQAVLLEGKGQHSIFAWGPERRHYAHAASYCILVSFQFLTSLMWSDSLLMWLIVCVWSSAHLLRVAAAPNSGFFTWFGMVKNSFLVIGLLCILVTVANGEEVPRDLDGITMLLHFTNIGKMFIVHPRYGPLIIMVQTMFTDITRMLNVVVFAVASFFCALRAVYRGATPGFSGEAYAGPFSLLVNVVWGPQLLWTVEGSQWESQTLILSQVLGISDEISLDVVGFCTGAAAVVVCPILLLNLLIAMMASSYARVEKDSDLEWKRFRASAVLVARELPLLPLPFNIPEDLLIVLRKLLRAKGKNSTEEGSRDEDAIRKELVAIEQTVAQWETRKTLEKLRALVTMDQVERVRMQGDAVLERVNLLYNATQLGVQKLDTLRTLVNEGQLGDTAYLA